MKYSYTASEPSMKETKISHTGNRDQSTLFLTVFLIEKLHSSIRNRSTRWYTRYKV